MPMNAGAIRSPNRLSRGFAVHRLSVNLRLVPGRSVSDLDVDAPPESPVSRLGEQTIRTLDLINRRVEALARELNVLGYFESDDDDRPRAA